MKTLTTSLCLLAAGLSASAEDEAAKATAPATFSDKLPITRVVLYKHGIGYFERQGTVNDEARIALRFKQSEMSDVLKSLTVLDRSGGAIEAIAYDSQKPPEMLLSEFAFDLRTDDPQQSMLSQLRGANVSVDFAGRGVVAGSVLGIDSRSDRVDGAEIKKPRLSLLTSTGQIVSGELDDIRSFKFDDAKLASEISRFLEVLRSTHRRDQRSLDLLCQGSGQRSVFASYAVDQPVWKATYRLVLDAGETTKKPYLQGWAVVDNTSDEDWTNVKLSLIAGLPVSFRQDLYTPEFRNRPTLDIQEIAVAKVLFDSESEEDGEERAKDARKDVKFKAGAYRGAGDVQAPVGGVDKAFGAAFEEVQSQSVTREIGDLLEYSIDHPVTIPRNRSALLPIVSGAVEGSKVALYSEPARGSNPFSAIRVKNTTGLSLESGPLTVLEGETYAGEAMLASLKPNELRYIPYAVDLGVKATTKLDSKTENVFKVAFSNGIMIASRYAIETKTYSFDNKNSQARTVVVEHARRMGLELRSPKATETELDRYRFEIAIPALETKAISVVEAWPTNEQFSIGSVSEEQLSLFVDRKMLNDATLAFLKEVVAARVAISKLDAAVALHDKELAEIHSDEDRLRKNREALGDSQEEKELVKLYVDQLRANEARVQALSKQLVELRQSRTDAQNALDKKVREFAIEYVLP